MNARLAYNYAHIDLETGMCIRVLSSSFEHTDPEYIPIARYNEEYMFKFYINGAWYEDERGTIPWSPEE